MIGALEVTDTAATAAEAPAADVAVEGGDFSFAWPGSIGAGEHVFSFVNTGAQTHEAVLVKLEGDATVEEFAAAFAPDAPPGPPPGVGVGGIVGIMPGASQEFSASLDPGRYAFVCFFTDPASQTPHFALGMQQTFEIQ